MWQEVVAELPCRVNYTLYDYLLRKGLAATFLHVTPQKVTLIGARWRARRLQRASLLIREVEYRETGTDSLAGWAYCLAYDTFGAKSA